MKCEQKWDVSHPGEASLYFTIFAAPLQLIMIQMAACLMPESWNEFKDSVEENL